MMQGLLECRLRPGVHPCSRTTADQTDTHLIGATVALIVSAVVVVATILTPALRPYIGGSTDNTFMDPVLGYNGIGRISGGNGGVRVVVVQPAGRSVAPPDRAGCSAPRWQRDPPAAAVVALLVLVFAVHVGVRHQPAEHVHRTREPRRGCGYLPVAGFW